MEQEIKTYDYNDWWDGKIHLAYAPTLFGADEEVIPGLSWNDIKEDDIPKIRSKQQEIFESQVQELFDKFKTTFLERYGNSQMKKFFLKDEIQQCMFLMFGKVPKGEFVFAEHWNAGYSTADLKNIQIYIDEVIKKGIPRRFDYIHSPNYPYQEKNKTPNEVYAQSLWNYFTWLESFQASLIKRGATERDIPQNREKSDNASQNNTHQFNALIFSNLNGFLFFQALLEKFEHEIREEPLAHLSFIYWKLKNDKFLNQIKPSIFREFLSEKPYMTHLEKIKTLDKCATPIKERIYAACKERFQAEK